MTYPPQDPGYQDPGYGAGGQPPGYQPSYPPPGAQPGYPPQPPQPAYGPPPGYPPQPPPGYPPPGYPPGTPGYPPQPPRGNRTGWIVGGIAGGVVLLLLVVGGVVIALQAGSSDDDPPGQASQDLPALPSQAPQPTAPETAPAPEPGGGSGTYGFVEGFCEAADLSPAFDVLPPEKEPSEWSLTEIDWGASSLMACSIDLEGGSSFALLSITVNTFEDQDEARSTYDTLPGDLVREPDTVDDIDGPWDEGSIELGGGPLIDYAAALNVLADNLAMTVDFSLWGDAASDDQLGDVVVQVTENILGTLAR